MFPEDTDAFYYPNSRWQDSQNDTVTLCQKDTHSTVSASSTPSMYQEPNQHQGLTMQDKDTYWVSWNFRNGLYHIKVNLQSFNGI